MKRCFLMLAILGAVYGQEQELEPPSRVARLSFLDGAVSFEAAGTPDWAPAQLNRPLTTGDRLYTEARARAELNTGTTAFRVAPLTGVNIDQLDDGMTRLILTEGALNFRVQRLTDEESIEIDTPNGTVQVNRPGVYRVNVYDNGRSEAVALVGELRVNGQVVGQRQSAVLSGAQGAVAIGPLPARDNFDQWAESRDRLADRSESARYLAPGTIGYEDLDANGSWSDLPEYGRVWQPRAVAAGWAPYRYGHWVWVAPWGWTWVDDAPWGFAPFHYGRWAYVRSSWFWVPGPVAVRPVYAPALVSFAVGGAGWGVSVGIGAAPVSWLPLGPGEVWVPGFRATPRYWERVNVHNTVIVNKTVINNYYTSVRNNDYTRVRETVYRNQTAPGGVTSVSREAFTSARPVHQSMISGAGPEGRRNEIQRAEPQRAEPIPTQQRMERDRIERRREPIPAARPEPRPLGREAIPEPTREARMGAAERAAHRPPDHIARENVRPQHMENRGGPQRERRP